MLELTIRAVQHTGLRAIALLSAGVGFIEVNSITKFANFSFYFAATATVLQFATFIACVFPQREVLKNLSRVNWVSGVSRASHFALGRRERRRARKGKKLISRCEITDRLGTHLGRWDPGSSKLHWIRRMAKPNVAGSPRK